MDPDYNTPRDNPEWVEKCDRTNKQAMEDQKNQGLISKSGGEAFPEETPSVGI